MQTIVYKENSVGRIEMNQEGMAPVYIASGDTTDVSALHLAELLSWTELLSDHAEILESLLPIETVQLEREQAVAYKFAFDWAYEQCLNCDVEAQAIRELSTSLRPMAKGLLGFKHDLADMQRAGEIHTLAWPSYLDHLARENSRFLDRQYQFLKDGSIDFDRGEILTFWSQITAEHFAVLAHLLDPVESEMISQAVDSNRKFDDMRLNHSLVKGKDPIPAEVARVIDFDLAALKGIECGSIASIISPLLADHIRREAILFQDELERADGILGVSATR